jgi:glycosyltransferase involved in cell wall biosynthesis
MRIGISTSVVQRGQTGIAQYLFALLRGFLSGATEHRFILFVLEEDRPLFNFAAGAMEIVVVPERFRPPAKNIWWHQAVLPGLVTKHALDVLHVPSYRRMLWPRPCPLVATIHDLAPFQVAGKYDWKRTLYGRTIVPRFAHRQDEIIAVSENTARDIAQFLDLGRERITVVHNGVEHGRFFPGSREQAVAEAAKNFDLHRPFFLYVARLEHPGKNHVRLIEAFNWFKTATRSSWELAFGGSDWHGADVIHAAIKKSPFADDIRVLGFVPDERLPDLYRAAEVFVYPSLYEGFGMPPTEAMACGCPVICSTRGSLGEIIGDAAAIIDPEDAGSITRRLAALASEADLRERLRVDGLARAKQFDWQKTASETLRVYERAAARRFGNNSRTMIKKSVPENSPVPHC